MANIQWTGGGSTNHPKDGSWSVGTNWAGNAIPSSADTVTFGGNGGATAYTATLDTNQTVQAVTFSAPAALATLAVGAQTLTVANNTTGAVTLNANAAITLTGGAISLTGGTNATIADAGSISGRGILTVSGTNGITGTGSITASGGTLELNSALTGNTLNLSVAGATDVLKVDKAGAVSSVTFGSTGKLEVGAAGTLTVTNALSIGGGTVALDGAGTTQLTDANGVTLAGGTINGTGGVAANTNISGVGTVAISISNAGTITASGGRLDLTGTVSGRTLAINTTSGSDLKIDGTTTSAAITINNAAQTLEVGAAGKLTFTGAESITNGTIQFDGGTLNGSIVNDTLTIGTGGKLTGSGTVNNAILTGAGTITASNGVLNLAGAVASGPSFVIDSGSASTLMFTGTATAANLISITNKNQTLEVGSAGSLTINGAESITNGTVKLDGGTLTDTIGTTEQTFTVGSGGTLTGFGNAPNTIILAGGTVAQSSGGVLKTVSITGFGTVNGVTGTTSPVTGATQIVASGGMLDLIGTVSGSQLVVDGTKAGVANLLKVDGNVTAGGDGSIQITGTNSTNQAVEIGAAGSLTLSKAQSIVGTIRLDGGSSTLTDSSGLSFNGGALLIGSGAVNANITGVSGSGNVVEASGGLLAMNGAVGGTHLTYEIANSAASVLEISAGGTTTGTFDFLGSAGELEFNGATALSENIVGLNVGTIGATTNFIDFLGSGLTVNDSTKGHTGSSGTFTLSDGTTLNLTGVTNSAGTWFLDWMTVGGNTEVFVSDEAICYAAGTHILTVTGERTVESLMAGDIVLTLAGGELVAQPVKWIGRRRIDLTAHPHPETVAPVRIARGAFADAMPHRDLLLSPDHAVFVDGKLICARQLVNGSTIRRETGWTAVEYYHVELDAHAILLAEGLPAESYLNTGNRGFFANSGEPLVLHPDLTDETDYPAREAGSCAPFVSDEASVLPVWQRLAERAAALGEPALRLATTDDPALRIVAKGRTVRPLYGEHGLYIFALPKGTTEVRVISRAGAPTDARPWLDDRRCLGVNVERIVMRGANELREVPVDHPNLTRGWHEVERDGVALRRWTSGDAVLPLPVLGGPTMLEIRAGNGGMAYVTDTGEQDQRAA